MNRNPSLGLVNVTFIRLEFSGQTFASRMLALRFWQVMDSL